MDKRGLEWSTIVKAIIAVLILTIIIIVVTRNTNILSGILGKNVEKVNESFQATDYYWDQLSENQKKDLKPADQFQVLLNSAEQALLQGEREKDLTRLNTAKKYVEEALQIPSADISVAKREEANHLLDRIVDAIAALKGDTYSKDIQAAVAAGDTAKAQSLITECLEQQDISVHATCFAEKFYITHPEAKQLTDAAKFGSLVQTYLATLPVTENKALPVYSAALIYERAPETAKVVHKALEQYDLVSKNYKEDLTFAPLAKFNAADIYRTRFAEIPALKEYSGSTEIPGKVIAMNLYKDLWNQYQPKGISFEGALKDTIKDLVEQGYGDAFKVDAVLVGELVDGDINDGYYAPFAVQPTSTEPLGQVSPLLFKYTKSTQDISSKYVKYEVYTGKYTSELDGDDDTIDGIAEEKPLRIRVRIYDAVTGIELCAESESMNIFDLGLKEEPGVTPAIGSKDLLDGTDCSKYLEVYSNAYYSDDDDNNTEHFKAFFKLRPLKKENPIISYKNTL